jgi:predicted O-methyltransferase YrrM
MTQQENDELMYSSPEDQAFYLKCVEGLPTLAGLNGTGKDEDGVPLPYGCGPHSVRCFREVVEIVKPTAIFEIGFNMGWSAALWLELTGGIVHSCDISVKEETLKAAELLAKKYNRRFHYYNRNHLIPEGFDAGWDMIFIDGSHLMVDVVMDIQDSLYCRTPFLVFDDILPEFGEVQEAIDIFSDELELIKVFGNIGLYKNKTL